jgi:hypothetical protein
MSYAQWRNSYTRFFVRLGIILIIILGFYRSRDSAVGIATAYWLDDLEVGVGVPVGSRSFTSPCRPDRLWGPPNLLYSGSPGALFRR